MGSAQCLTTTDRVLSSTGSPLREHLHREGLRSAVRRSARHPPVDGPRRLVPVNRPIGPLASGCLRWAVVGIALGVVEVGAARE